MSSEKRFVVGPDESCPRWPEGADVSTVAQEFASTAEKYADKNALMYKSSKEQKEWTAVTWKQYHACVRDTAKALLAQGVKATDAVNILGFNSKEWFYATFGAMFVGAIPAGIYGTNNADGCWFVAHHSKAKIIFVDTKARLNTILSVRDKLPELKKIVMWEDTLFHDECPSEEGVMSWADFIAAGKSVEDSAVDAAIAALDAGKCAFLSYTSGTTGRPKAVMHSHDTIINATKVLYARMLGGVSPPWGSEERGISYLPLSHVAGSVPMFAQACSGMEPDTTYFAFPDALKGSIAESLKDVKPTSFIGVPRIFEKFCAGVKPAVGEGGPLHGKPTVYARGALGLQACKAAYVGSAPVDVDVMKFFDSIDLPIMDIYGMTENFAVSHCNSPGEGNRKYERVGKPTPGGDTKLAEGTNEILTRSRSTMLGYMYNEEKTKEAIDEDGWLHTGDVGSIDDDGFYSIIGRIKELIITSGGENCAPVILEAALKKELPAISNVMVIGDKRNFISAVFTLVCKPTPLGTFTNELDGASAKVDPDAKTIEDAQKSAVWKKYLDDGVARANESAISRAQQTKKWAILSREFSIPTGELGPTLKLKRIEVNANFKEEIDAIYA